jgi:DNA ligase-4
MLKHDRCILDGEMLVWDPVSERVLPFGTLKTAALGALSCSLFYASVRSPILRSIQERAQPTTMLFVFAARSIVIRLTLVTVKVFDLLYLNGLSLIHKKTTTRKNNLRSCLTEKKGRIEFITQFEGKTGKDVRARMEDIMEAKGEGLILKHPTAEYVLNGRNKDWIKVSSVLLGTILC